MARVDSATGLKSAYTFANLVVGQNNHVATGACHEVVKSPGEMYNPLVIYGPAGVGKTHLMQAVAHEMLAMDATLKVKYISAERFMNEIVTAIAEDRVVEIRMAYSKLDLLIIDDVQYLVESKIAQEELFHIFNNMHQENRQVILAADRTPNQLSSLSKGIRSRLEWGLAADIQPPDEGTRLEILRRKQAAQGMAMADEMLRPVAHALHSNVRELEGFLKRIHAYVNLSHQALSMDLIRAVVRELAPDAQEFIANGAALNNESPGLSLAPAVAPDLQRILKNENGHKSTNGKTVAPKPVEPVEEKMEEKIEDTVAAAEVPAPPVVEEIPGLDDIAEEELPAGHKEVAAAFFYPEGKDDALETVHRKFQDVIKKHKLKFRLKRVHNQGYTYKGKIDYARIADACKDKKVPVAIVIGPPPESLIPEQDFHDPLTVALDAHGVSLQLVSWSEIKKDYRYLNLALDIALVKAR